MQQLRSIIASARPATGGHDRFNNGRPDQRVLRQNVAQLFGSCPASDDANSVLLWHFDHIVDRDNLKSPLPHSDLHICEYPKKRRWVLSGKPQRLIFKVAGYQTKRRGRYAPACGRIGQCIPRDRLAASTVHMSSQRVGKDVQKTSPATIHQILEGDRQADKVDSSRSCV